TTTTPWRWPSTWPGRTRRRPRAARRARSVEHLRHVDHLHALHLAQQAVEPGLVRGPDDGQHARAGPVADRGVDVGHHAQVARLPPGHVALPEALRRG